MFIDPDAAPDQDIVPVPLPEIEILPFGVTQLVELLLPELAITGFCTTLICTPVDEDEQPLTVVVTE